LANLTNQDIGACACTQSFCGCSAVPITLNLTSTLYGAFVLTWDSTAVAYISNTLVFNYPGSVACPSNCAALAGVTLRFQLSCLAGAFVVEVYTLGTIAGPCPVNNTGPNYQLRGTYTIGAHPCSPFSITATLGTNTAMACGPGDTVTITP
jgi:hypothetical protein